MANWVFAELTGAAIRRDPNESELFKTEQAEEGEYAWTDALVREILQNSMDAAIGNDPVRVRLALHGNDELPDKARLKEHFARLEYPLKYREIEFKHGVPQLQNGFLVCEDFGTRGLSGNPMLVRDPDPNDPVSQNFFWFWRNIGRSGKTGDDLGRWGLGKTVYREASKVGSMLGLTVRESDGKHLLMGQAVLRIHDVDGIEYMPEGFWCSGCDTTGHPMPIEDSTDLDQFRQEWKLTRNNEPGLSVVVPYVAAELQGFQMLQAVAAHFFIPILRGELIVEIAGPDVGDVRLDQSTIQHRCKEIVWNGPKRTKRHAAPPIGFAKTCLSTPPHATTNLLGSTSLPTLDTNAFDKETLESLQSSFAAESLVAIRVQMNLPKRNGDSEIGEFDVFLKRGDSSQRRDSYYVREGMTITKVNSRAAARGIQALVLVDRGPLASLLGDSEGPAHEDWDTSEERPDRIWKVWKGRVKFVRRIVDSMVELLTPPVEQADFDLLSEFFSIEQYRAPKPKLAPNDNGKPSPGFDPITPSPQWYRVSPRTLAIRIAHEHCLS